MNLQKTKGDTGKKMSARSSKQHQALAKLLTQTEKLQAHQTKTSVLPKHPPFLSNRNQNCQQERISLRRALQPTLHLNRINNRSGCLSKCKKSPACANLRRPGLYSRIGLNSGVFVGGGLSGIFFPLSLPVSNTSSHLALLETFHLWRRLLTV